MSDLEQLVLSISADTAQMRRALKRLEGDTNASTRRVETQFDRMGKRIDGSFAAIGRRAKGALAGIVAGFSLREASSLIDTATRITNSLRVAGVQGEQLTVVYDQLFASAQRNAVPLEGLATLFQRISGAQQELGISTQQVIGFTETVAQALRATGGSAEDASGALLQLGQSLAGGKIQAEEYNSLIDGLRPLLEAAAFGIKEAGGSVGRLTQLVKAGKVSSKAFFDGIEAGSEVIADKLVGAESTISQRFVRLQNVLVDAAGKFDDATKASGRFGGGLDGLTDAIANFNMDAAVRQVDAWIGKLQEADRVSTGFLNNLGEKLGLDMLGEAVGGAVGYSSNRNIRRRMGALEDEAPSPTSPALQDFVNRRYGANIPAPAIADGKTDRLPPPPRKPSGDVSLSDPRYAVPGDGKGKKAKADKDDNYERELKQIRERTAAIEAETTAQSQLNPLINDYGFSVARSSEAQALLTAAKEAGTAAGKELSDVQQLLSGNFDNLSPKAREQAETMLSVAEGYASAEAAADRLAEKQDKVRENAEEAAAIQKDLARGVVDGFLAGKDASEVLADALSKLGQKFLDLAFDAAFDPKSGGGGLLSTLLGGLGSIFGSGKSADPWANMRVPAYAKGTNYHPGGMALIGERGPELLDLPRGAKVTPNHMIPRVPELANGGRGTPAITVQFSPVIDNRGASVEAVARTQQQLDRMKADMTHIVVQAVRKAQNSRDL